MGILIFPSAGEGVLPMLVMTTVMTLALLKNTVRSWLLQLMGGANWTASGHEQNPDGIGIPLENARTRRISITQFKSLCHTNNRTSSSITDDGKWRSSGVECCVCLSKFEAEEEVSELLSCKHFFHKVCLEKWFDNKHSTCPLCRSIL